MSWFYDKYYHISDPLSLFKHLVRLCKNTKRPIEKFKNVICDREAVLEDYKAGKCDLGLVLRNDFVVLDIDPRNNGSHIQLGYDFLEKSDTLIQKTSGGGYHIIYRRTSGANPTNLIKMQGVDVLYGWKYIKYYGFINDRIPLPFSDIPERFFYRGKKRGKIKSSPQTNYSPFKVKIANKTLISFLNDLDVLYFNSNDTWFNFIHSFLSLFKDIDEGREALIDWSSKDARYSLIDIENRIYSLSGSKNGGYKAVKVLEELSLIDESNKLKELIADNDDVLH